MNEKLNYISDQELEQLILQVEQKELVAAPPDLMEGILEAAGLSEEAAKALVQPPKEVVQKAASRKPAAMRKKEFYAYCFRVITSVAAAIALVFLLPEVSGMAWQETPLPDAYRQETPSWEEVADTVPSKEEVVLAEKVPTKEEVLNDTDLLDRVLNRVGWFGKKEKEE